VINAEAAKGFSRYLVPAEMRIQGATANPTPRIVGVVEDGVSQPTAYVRADELINWLPAHNLAGTLNRDAGPAAAGRHRRAEGADLAARRQRHSGGQIGVQRVDSRHTSKRH